ncbi:hypothetical protein FIT80_00645 [Candidatus Methylopumilus universalis]|uniref:HGGxSTG domain-containing protein n=1 Tax=Candidatus Methylopumilus universalis TaxID=2588536 RepID=UPI00111D87BA|nr:hypothetical protein FIT80_00645 [Candidatus Methylopumilus universalis]
MRVKLFCNAYSRSTKRPCIAKALSNGRCRNHGGLSTGAKTSEGKKRIAEATRKRMINGQKYKAQEGFKRWIAAGGRDFLSRIMIARWRLRKRVLEAF